MCLGSLVPEDDTGDGSEDELMSMNSCFETTILCMLKLYNMK